eukprot:Colp12_sorted_trinity150504_noHs@15267
MFTLQSHGNQRLQNGQTALSLQLIDAGPVHHVARGAARKHHRGGGGLDRHLGALSQVQQPVGLHLQTARRGVLAHQQCIDVQVVVVEVGVDAALGGVEALRGDVRASAQRVRADVLDQRLEKKLRELGVRGGHLGQTVGRLVRGGVTRGVCVGVVVRKGIGVAGNVTGTLSSDHNAASGGVDSQTAASAESDHRHGALDHGSGLSDEKVHHGRTHADGNDGYIHALEVASDGGEASAGGNGLRSRTGIQKGSDLLSSVLGTNGENSVGNISEANLHVQVLSVAQRHTIRVGVDRSVGIGRTLSHCL